MQDNLFLAIFIMALANLLTRAFPFIFFHKKEPHPTIRFISDFFPPIIMTILVFYTLSEVNFTIAPYGAKEIISIIFTTLLHTRFNNYLISIFGGTIFYMYLIH
jgi:branched-subunit amino acid transport protein AzlD